MGIGDEASSVNETRDQATLNACDNLEGTGNHKRPAGWGSARALQKHLLHYLLLQWRRTYWLIGSSDASRSRLSTVDELLSWMICILIRNA